MEKLKKEHDLDFAEDAGIHSAQRKFEEEICMTVDVFTLLGDELSARGGSASGGVLTQGVEFFFSSLRLFVHLLSCLSACCSPQLDPRILLPSSDPWIAF